MSTAIAATLTDTKGNTTALDKQTYAAVRAFLQALGVSTKTGEGKGEARLTTGQAAEILGTSSRTVARLIDAGTLPGSRMGSGHRTVLLSDVMEFKRSSEAGRHAKLERVRDLAAEGGYYEHNDAMEDYLREFE